MFPSYPLSKSMSTVFKICLDQIESCNITHNVFQGSKPFGQFWTIRQSWRVFIITQDNTGQRMFSYIHEGNPETKCKVSV